MGIFGGVIQPTVGYAYPWTLGTMNPRKKSEPALEPHLGLCGQELWVVLCLVCDLEAGELQDQDGHAALALWILCPDQLEEVSLKFRTQHKSLRMAYLSFPLFIW